MNETTPIIRVEHLGKTFKTKKNEVTALRDINLEVHEGEIYGIIGMSGAGKSTLVRCLNLLERPTEGSVYFCGTDITKLSRKELEHTRQSIAMIFQQFNLLQQRTAIGNICFPMEIAGYKKSDADKRAKALMKTVGLPDKCHSYPSELSGGQQQRVAIARALAMNPTLLLCDEPTSALDPKTTQQILDLLKEINQKLGITIIIITHEMRVVEDICTHVAIIDESRIAESGPVEEIFSHPKSAAGRRFVFPDGEDQQKVIGRRLVRIVFSGNSSYEPVIADMVLCCKAPVNIMFADTRNVNGKAFGQIIIQLPEDERIAEKMIGYLKARDLEVEEVTENV